MTTDIIRTTNAMDVMTLGTVLARSGYFNDAKDEAQAIVKVLAGQELGIGPIAAMMGIHIIKGRVGLSANLMAAKIKGSGKYDYRVKVLTDQECSIEFLEKGQPVGVSTFTAADAKRAGTQNMSAYPRNMLFARALSNGAKWYCPDAFNGSAVYTPDELSGGPIIDGTGEYIDVQPVPVEAPAQSSKRDKLLARIEELWNDLDQLTPDAPVSDEHKQRIQQADVDYLLTYGKKLAEDVKKQRAQVAVAVPEPVQEIVAVAGGASYTPEPSEPYAEPVL